MKVCTYNEFEYYKIFGYLRVCEYCYVNFNPVCIFCL
jgi:hypothetical protein